MIETVRRLKLVSSVTFFIISIGLCVQSCGTSFADLPTWNGITPSVTTRDETEVLLGEPDNTWLCMILYEGVELRRYETECESGTEVVHYGYDHEQLPGKPYGWHEIHFNSDDAVDYIIETRWADSDAESTSTENLLATYGIPEEVTWSRRGVRTRALLYCEQGMILHGVLIHGENGERDIEIREVVYFKPMATEECINKFFNEIATTNPYKDSDVEGSLDPWGFTDLP